MTLFTSLAILALVFFIAHVVLLFTSFGKNGYQKTRYLYSHVTLWVCGAILFVLASMYAGKQVSGILDVFDTPFKQLLIIGVVLLLSLTAHTIVRFLVMPKYNMNK
jgi:TM2 domain-containing membrane protein YozV